jgi:hypothetical protein
LRHVDVAGIDKTRHRPTSRPYSSRLGEAACFLACPASRRHHDCGADVLTISVDSGFLPTVGRTAAFRLGAYPSDA